MAAAPSAPLRVFICYIDDDDKYRRPLRTHLERLAHDGLIELWDSTNIAPGTDALRAVERVIEASDIAIVLVSASFLVSKVADDELPRLFAAKEALGLSIWPVIVRRCGFEGSQLAGFQPVNNRDKPVNSMTASQRDEVWEKVAAQVSELAQARRHEREKAAPPVAHERAAVPETPPVAEAPDPVDLLPLYREKVRTDPRVAYVQILSMTQPLDVANVYVQVRLHQESGAAHEFAGMLKEATGERDPNSLLRTQQRRVESRASAAVDPAEAVNTYRRCVIVGDPGAGKTTLLKYLALKAVNGQLPDLPTLPIHIELNAFAGSGQADLLAFAAATWEERYGFPKAQAHSFMEQHLNAGGAMLLLDALDETVIGTTVEEAEASYRRVSSAILAAATRYPRAPVVVTARKAGYYQRPRLAGFTELETLEFRPQDIRQFIEKWFEHHTTRKQISAADLNERLQRQPRMLSLAANPLLLSLIVIVYEDYQALPSSPAHLYNQCVETLLGKWDSGRDVTRNRQFSPDHKRQLLEEAAWHFHNQRLRYFPAEELLALIAGFLAALGIPESQNAAILREISQESGLLKEQAQGWYGFLHLTLQEYFTARYAMQQSQAEVFETLLKRLNDPWWEEVLLLYAGSLRDTSPLLNHLVGQDTAATQDDIFASQLIMAGRCLAAHISVRQPGLRQHIIDSLFQVLTATPYTLNRQRAAETLAAIGGGDVNTRLLHLISLDNMSMELRNTVIRALGESGERAVAKDLLHFFKSESKYRTFEFEETIGRLADHSLTSELLDLLANKHQASTIRAGAAHIFHVIGDRSLASSLLTLLENEDDPYVHINIALALGTCGDRSVVPALVDKLTNHKAPPEVSEYIAMSLRKLGDHTTARDLLPLLSDAMLDPDTSYAVTFTIVSLSDTSLDDELLQLLTNIHAFEYTRIQIAIALARRRNQSIIPVLRQLHADAHLEASVRLAIAVALSMLGDRSHDTELLHALAHSQFSEPFVRHDAISSLAQHTDGADLLRLLASPETDLATRSIIADALAKSGKTALVPALRQMLLNETMHADIRVRIAKAIAQLADDEETVGALVPLLRVHYLEDTIHSALWPVSRRAGLRLLWIGGRGHIAKNVSVEKV
ncbi:MAG: HEAT repeat domain-containing protein [Chloroflexota bacterium]|nr:HEAT repeat domain-containing protein [Chloroflexota bacterium]